MSLPWLFYNFFFDLFVAFLFLVFSGLTYIAAIRNHNEPYSGKPRSKALVIVPCRGLDYSLEANLRSIMKQDYGHHDIIAVVDSADDASVPVLNAVGMKWMLTTDRCLNCSGKVRAISSAINGSDPYEVYVIADSDILVKPDWLSKLLCPLVDPQTGVSTTFPYFEPVGGFWSKVKLIWGFVGLGMMESSITRFGWGGSLAFRAELIQGEGMEFFRNFVSDDIALTKLCKKMGLKIAYVKEAMPTINSPDDFATFMEWANRQTALSVYSTRSVLRLGLIFYGASILLFISSVILTFLVFPLFAFFLIPALINAARAVKRSGKLPVYSFFISLLIPFIYIYNLTKAAGMKSISWRGRDYSLEE